MPCWGSLFVSNARTLIGRNTVGIIAEHTGCDDTSRFIFPYRPQQAYDEIWKSPPRFTLREIEDMASLCLVIHHLRDLPSECRDRRVVPPPNCLPIEGSQGSWEKRHLLWKPFREGRKPRKSCSWSDLDPQRTAAEEHLGIFRRSQQSVTSLRSLAARFKKMRRWVNSSTILTLSLRMLSEKKSEAKHISDRKPH